MNNKRWWIISLIQITVIYIGFWLLARWSVTHTTAFSPDGWSDFEAVGFFLFWLSVAVGALNTTMIGIKGMKMPDEFVLILLSCVMCATATPSDQGRADAVLVGVIVFIASVVFIFLGAVSLEFKDSQRTR